MLNDPFFSLLDSSLAAMIPSDTVELSGDWSTNTRKTYESKNQDGSGIGPFIEIEDRRWRGTLSCPSTVTGILFLVTANKVHWAKAPTIAPTLPVNVGLHAYAGYAATRATFSAAMGGASLPGVPVAAPAKLDEICPPGPRSFSAGRVIPLACTEGAAFVVLVLPGIAVKMGRNHLWRLRDELASSLPMDIRELLTRRRSGEFGMATTADAP